MQQKRFTTEAKQAHSCLARVLVRVLPRQLNNGQQTTARAARRLLTQHVSIRRSSLFPRNGKRLIATFHHFTPPVARALSQDLHLNQHQPQAESNCMHKEILISVLAAVGGGWSFLPSFSSKCRFFPFLSLHQVLRESEAHTNSNRGLSLTACWELIIYVIFNFSYMVIPFNGVCCSNQE